ncbi:MAG: helix-turn-helix domain-containing protein [Candidatus Binataceae bacterium]
MAELKPLFVNVPTAALLIGISRSKAYELAASGELPSTRFGASLRIPVAAIEQRVQEALEGQEPVR